MTVGELEGEGRRKSPRTTRTTMPHVSLLDEASLKAKTAGLQGILVEHDGEVLVACVRDELVRETWST